MFCATSHASIPLVIGFCRDDETAGPCWFPDGMAQSFEAAHGLLCSFSLVVSDNGARVGGRLARSGPWAAHEMACAGQSSSLVHLPEGRDGYVQIAQGKLQEHDGRGRMGRVMYCQRVDTRGV